MYTIVKSKKKIKLLEHDYVFEEFEEFKELASNVTIPLIGRYSVGIITEDVSEISNFIANEALYEHMIVTLYIPENIVQYLLRQKPTLNVQDAVSSFVLFTELLSSKNLLLDKKVMNVLYSSISKDYSEMDKVTTNLQLEFGERTLITEKMLSEIMILNKTVYPRSVLIDFIQNSRWRWQKLDKCLEELGNDIIYFSMRKTLKKFIAAKNEFYKSGITTKFNKQLNTYNIELLYYIFMSVEFDSIKDVKILFEIYERSYTNDIAQRKSDS